jgi:hypothetical protein
VQRVVGRPARYRLKRTGEIRTIHGVQAKTEVLMLYLPLLYLLLLLLYLLLLYLLLLNLPPPSLLLLSLPPAYQPSSSASSAASTGASKHIEPPWMSTPTTGTPARAARRTAEMSCGCMPGSAHDGRS